MHSIKENYLPQDHLGFSPVLYAMNMNKAVDIRSAAKNFGGLVSENFVAVKTTTAMKTIVTNQPSLLEGCQPYPYFFRLNQKLSMNR